LNIRNLISALGLGLIPALTPNNSFAATVSSLANTANTDRDLGAFIQLPAGTVHLDTVNDPELQDHSSEVFIPPGLEMQANLMTQSQFYKLMGYNPSHYRHETECADFKSENLSCPSNPVDSVTYREALLVTSALTNSSPCYHYRLPSSAEWQWAATSGGTHRFIMDSHHSVEQIQDYGWIFNNSEGHTHPVGTKLPNAWGFFDMIGNASSWTQDQSTAFQGMHLTKDEDPLGFGIARVVRGSSVSSNPETALKSHSDWSNPYDRSAELGLRLVRELKEPVNPQRCPRDAKVPSRESESSW
jgi:formylglycine-generating enzyme required for sulfatase activity